jgi:hypothetical protein
VQFRHSGHLHPRRADHDRDAHEHAHVHDQGRDCHARRSCCHRLRGDVRQSSKGFLAQRFEYRAVRCATMPGARRHQRRKPIPDARQCNQPLFDLHEFSLSGTFHLSHISLLR